MALLLAAAAALCPVLLVWGLHLRAAPVPAERDAAVAAARRTSEGFGPLGRLVEAAGRPLAPPLLRALGPARRARAARRIARAGVRMTVEDYARHRAGSLAVYGGAALLMLVAGKPVFAVPLLAIGLVQTDVMLWYEIRGRQAEIEKALPDFLDVLTVTVSAGLSFRHALDRVAAGMDSALADEMRTALRRMELGTPLREAFEELRRRNDSPALSSFVTAILQAEELGAPLSAALRQISVDMRREAHQAARRRAQRAEPQITLITTFFMIPGVVLLIAAALFFGTGGALLHVLG
ncbi:type II secretion system F family protein [Actinomadura atramentaria]|uniref:type II secretion system F family protein n=1 Tax=Actinomadura atramentaria TaxID=1990 RepID=UPI00036CEAD8|nr:type II secretion system F family protein [Actinomadura atramentaria]